MEGGSRETEREIKRNKYEVVGATLSVFSQAYLVVSETQVLTMVDGFSRTIRNLQCF